MIKKVLHLVAAAAGRGEYAAIGFVAQQIALIGLWQWLLLVGSLAAGTSLTAHAGRIRPMLLHVLAQALPRQAFLRSGQRSREKFGDYPVAGSGPIIAVSWRSRQKHAGRREVMEMVR